MFCAENPSQEALTEAEKLALYKFGIKKMDVTQKYFFRATL